MAETPNLGLRVNGPVNTKASATPHSAEQFVWDYDANMETIDAAFENVAPLDSPAFTGDPTAPTQPDGDNTTKIATTAFVERAVSEGGGAVSSVFGRTGDVEAQSGDYVVSEITGAAPLASPTFTGTPAAPTPAAADNTTKIATTAFVQGELTAKAPLASPTFTGDPKAPTPAVDDNDTSIATTAFVNGQNKITINAQTGTSYAILAADNGKLITFSNASDIAASIAAASGFPTGWYVRLKNIGASTVILTPTTSTVGGGVKLFMPPGSGCLMTHDGTNYILPEENLDTSAGGGSYFIPDGTMRPLIGFGAAAIVNVDNAVCGILCNLDRAVLVNSINFSHVANASGSSQTAAVGIFTGSKNFIVSSGVKTFANGASQSYPSTTITGGYVFLPGTYRVCWTVSKATLTFVSSATLIGAATSASWNGNFTTPLMCFTSNQSPVSGDLPATLGTLSSMLASGDNAGNIPMIFFKT